MTHITLGGNPIETTGTLPALGSEAPEFTLTSVDLSDRSLHEFLGKRVILNIFPSVDTATCSLSVKRFNQDASILENTVILCISRDLPFAQQRFCAAESVSNLHMLSEFKNTDFSLAYGLAFANGPLQGLHSRAVVVIDEAGKVIYTEQISEVTHEPNYEAALASLS